MELLKWSTNIKSWIRKYKYAMAVLLVGLLLMMIPTRQTISKEIIANEPRTTTKCENLGSELSELLSSIEGAGKVKVMLTVAEGERTLYQTDSTYSQSDTGTNSRTQTIIITDRDRNQTGLIHQENPPV